MDNTQDTIHELDEFFNNLGVDINEPKSKFSKK